MQPTVRSRPQHRPIRLALLVLVAVLAVPGAAALAGSPPTKRVVKLEESESGGPLLANLKGRTLYSLSVEKHGKFICTAGCLSMWHPLVVPQGARPTGPVKLGTVERPDGRIQVTYRGRPLYSFAEDTKTGETNGEGIKDVGTWHAAKPGDSSAPQPTQPEPYPSTTYPTTAPPQETPPQSPPAEPPYEYPPYGY
jgi:predicted lipoprotein with Yx(FWY)xxD motif